MILRHKRNEGEQGRYGALHQWNVDVVDGSLVLWNNAVELDVGSALEGSRCDGGMDRRQRG